MTPHPSLLSIIAYARSGALDYACRLFLEGGFELVGDNPAVLSVRGRLLKDRALAAEGAERRRLYLEAADAYARAGEIGGATYPLINAATLSLLAGRREQSLSLASKLLERTLAGGDEQETPYYRTATHAEALLLLGRIAPAKKIFAEAVALAPRAYEDHASTLRQFGLILGALGKDAAWLDSFRPPRSLHFAGHATMAVDGAALGRHIRTAIRKERIGFGYGALAAGADILVAEALLGEGAELHIVLPGAEARFRETSVTNFGDGWATRFDHIVEHATSVRSIASASDPFSPHAIRLAAEVAMGCAVMQANMLMTEAVQLVILDGPRGAGGGDWIGTLWKKSGRRQHALATSRKTGRAAPAARPAAAEFAPACLAAMLRIDLAGLDATVLSRDVLPLLKKTLAKAARPLLPPRWNGEAVLTAYDTTASAAGAALAAAGVSADVSGVRIAGHYAIVRQAKDAFSGQPFLIGSATEVLAQVVRSTPLGAVHLTEDFAAALHAGPTKGPPRTEYVGDLPTGAGDETVRLFSLKR